MNSSTAVPLAFWLLVCGCNFGLASGGISRGDWYEVAIGIFGGVPALVFAWDAARRMFIVNT